MCPLNEEKKGISNIYNEFRRPKGANSWTVRREGRCYVKLHGTKSNARRKEAIDTTSLDPDFSPPLFSTLNLHATFTLYVVRTT